MGCSFILHLLRKTTKMKDFEYLHLGKTIFRLIWLQKVSLFDFLSFRSLQLTSLPSSVSFYFLTLKSSSEPLESLWLSLCYIPAVSLSFFQFEWRHQFFLLSMKPSLKLIFKCYCLQELLILSKGAPKKFLDD
jgi:hypothetical protein